MLLFGAVNLFADLTYEAARSVTGPFLATLVRRYPRAYWWYCASAGLVGFGFADYALLAHHFSRTHVVAGIWIPIFYSLSMAAGGLGSLVVGRLFDRVGLIVLLPVTLIGAVYAPLAFLGGFALALVGALLWGVGLGAHESVMQAAVAHMVSADRLGSVYGLFGAVFGIAWFIGSAALEPSATDPSSGPSCWRWLRNCWRSSPWQAQYVSRAPLVVPMLSIHRLFSKTPPALRHARSPLRDIRPDPGTKTACFRAGKAAGVIPWTPTPSTLADCS